MELLDLIKTKQVSSVEVVAAHLNQVERLNPSLNAVVTLAPDSLEQARHADACLQSGETTGSLHGLPLTIKDTIATAGLTTTSGSRLRADYFPIEDATVLSRLKAAGAIILGKTNTPEMAIPYETDNPVFGRTNNPYNLAFTPGGSSGGEAAAIAACLSPGGLGSDLSGSIRVPAHFCGIVGLRPTSGLVPMQGHLPAADGPLAFGACIGPMARRVEDVSLLFKVLTDDNVPTRPFDERSDKGMRVSWYDYDGVAPVSSETKHVVRAGIDALRLAGFEVSNERPPGVESGSRLWIDLFSRAAAEDLRDFYSRSENLAGPQVRRVLEPMKRPGPEDVQTFQHALKERNHLREELLTWMKTAPLILAPVGATAAFPHETQRLDIEGKSVSVFRAFSYSQTVNVFDLPSIVVRAGQTTEGLPIGIQIIGPPFQEDLILAAARIVEETTGGWQPPPNWVLT